MSAVTSTTKWYKQTAVWAVIISVIALVLSQLPPIYDWIPRERFKLEISDKIKLPNNLGILGYEFQIDIKNIGNRPLHLSNLSLVVTTPSGKEKIVKAEGVSQNVGGYPYNRPIVSTMIKVGESWSEWVMFYPSLSPSEEEEANNIRGKLSESYFSKIRAVAPKDFNPNYPVELDAKLVAEAVNLFNRRSELEKGTYKVSIKCDINGKAISLKQFEFTIYDDQIRTYRSYTEGYKYGYGLITQGDPTKEIWITISKLDK